MKQSHELEQVRFKVGRVPASGSCRTEKPDMAAHERGCYVRGRPQLAVGSSRS